MKTFYKVVCIFCFFYSNSFGQVSFTPVTSPPDNIYKIVSDVATNNLFACSASNVLYSTDSGVSWGKTANPTGTINTLYISPSGVLHAGTTSGVYKYNGLLTNTWTSLAGAPTNCTALIELAGNLYAGTGSTGNIIVTNTSPINYGTGIFLYNGSAWSSINSGINNLPGNTVLPYIKAFEVVQGQVVAATYGNGVITYNGTWSSYGTTGLANANVNCLLVSGSNLFAGTDAGVSLTSATSSSNTWSSVNSGLTANKPVRSVTVSGGKIYAGLGFYHYQKGTVPGEIFSTINNGTSWQTDYSGFNSTAVMSLATHTSGKVLAAACGVWAVNGTTWTPSFTLNGTLRVYNKVYQLVKNSKGYLYARCTNLTGNVLGYGGVFKSMDNGNTWTSINTNINCVASTVIFVGSDDNLWLGVNQFTGNNPNPRWTNPELYRSTDDGATWVKNTSIVAPNADYAQIAEAPNGKIYVTNSFGQLTTNISSTTDGINFDNSLNPPSTPNGYKAYGLAINSKNEVFLGTETGCLLRSVNNGASFQSVTYQNTGPGGNNSADIDPYTDNLTSGATHGYNNGVQVSKNFWGAAAANTASLGLNGTYMFPFNNLPDYTGLNHVITTRNGIMYGMLNSYNIGVAGFYYSDGTFSSSTVFTRVTNGICAQLNPIPAPCTPLSYPFVDLMTDDCGYLYGASGNSGGIYKSTTIIDAPGKCNLLAPSNNSATSLNPAFSWAHNCGTSLNYTIEVASDAAFTNIINTASNLSTPNYTYTNTNLISGTTYYWHVNATNTGNALGTSLWSKTYSFTVNNTLSIKLISFDAITYNNEVKLRWTTAYETNNDYYTIERSADGINFQTVAKINSNGNTSAKTSYSAKDVHTNSGVSYYRLKYTDLENHSDYSNLITVNFGMNAMEISIYPNPNSGVFTIKGAKANSQLSIFKVDGKVILKTKIVQNNPVIDLTKQANGAYFIDVLNQGVRTTKKVIVVH